MAVAVDGAPTDLSASLPDGAHVQVITSDSDSGRHVLRHSTAHVLAQAVTDLWPGAHYAIGPAIEDGFYYDFELPGGAHFSEDDLARIEARMREIIAEDQPFTREEHTVAEGLKLFADQPYKRRDHRRASTPRRGRLSEGVVSTYRNDGKLRGPLPRPARPVHRPARLFQAHQGGCRLLARRRAPPAAAAHLRHGLGVEGGPRRPPASPRGGGEARPPAARAPSSTCSTSRPEIGGGLPVFHPKGGLIRKLMEDYSRAEHEKSGYQFVWTPHLAKSTLYETSGHLEWYAESMYPPMEMEGATYYPKPMNCPMHILIYKADSAPTGTCRSGSSSSAPSTASSAPVCSTDCSGSAASPRTTPTSSAPGEQLATELADLLAFVLRILRAFGLTEFEAELATRPDKFVGDPAEWDLATEALRQALETAGIPYVVAEGEGAFYAPKIDVHVRDAIGRRWQVSTLQVDFQLPQRFEMEYVGADNNRHRPYMIHRALFGSVERFFAILLEHYAGAFPAWLAPIQARILPVRDDHETVRRDRGGRAARHRGPGRRGRRRRAPRVAGQEGQAGEDPLRPRRRRRRRRGRYGRGEFPGKRPARPRRARGRLRGPRCGPRSRPMRRQPISSDLAGAAVGRAGVASTSNTPPRRLTTTMAASFAPSWRAACPTRRPSWSGATRMGSVAAILNAYPYTSGHLMVHADLRHVADLDELDAAEGEAVWQGVVAGGAGPEGGVPTGRPQPGRQPGRGRRSRGAGPLPRACPAPVERRHQLHDPGRRAPGCCPRPCPSRRGRCAPPGRAVRRGRRPAGRATAPRASWRTSDSRCRRAAPAQLPLASRLT